MRQTTIAKHGNQVVLDRIVETGLKIDAIATMNQCLPCFSLLLIVLSWPDPKPPQAHADQSQADEQKSQTESNFLARFSHTINVLFSAPLLGKAVSNLNRHQRDGFSRRKPQREFEIRGTCGGGCFRFAWYCIRRADSRACCTPDRVSAMRRPMIAMTTSNSRTVNPRCEHRVIRTSLCSLGLLRKRRGVTYYEGGGSQAICARMSLAGWPRL